MGQRNQIVDLRLLSKHIILYALNKYERGRSILDDMWTIISTILNMEKEDLIYEDIMQEAINAFLDISDYGPVEEAKLCKIDIFNDWKKHNITDEEFLEHLFDFMASVELKDRDDGFLIDLGEPDGTILPIQEYYYM